MVDGQRKAMNILCILAYLSLVSALDQVSHPVGGEAATKLPPCAACLNLVGSFEAGLERTSRGKLEGGDAAWEEKMQSSGYANSEVRFVEIQEKLCSDVDRGEAQCHDNHHHWEDHLQSWWTQMTEQHDSPSLKDHLCIHTLKVCCPPHHFGPECKSCPIKGFNSQICSGNGKCKGSGTRKGNGKCACDTGYTGTACESCSTIGFYEAYKDESKILCSPCHKGCKDHCSGPGPKSCISCKAGYQMDTEHGCTDIDECIISKPCIAGKFCVNTEGTFRCMNCDKSCQSCESDGPDSCIACTEGYQKNKDGVCISDDTAGPETEAESKEKTEL